MASSDESIDFLFMEYLQEHFKDVLSPEERETLYMFMGPDNGANNPVYFAKLDRLYDKYRILKKILPTVRATAGLYDKFTRSNAGIVKAWAIIMDFDYDRGEWTGIDRKIQDMTLNATCSALPPTAVVKTGHGWHLYWLMQEPLSEGSYAYIASMLRMNLKADARSILPVQCMNFHNRNERKPAFMTDALRLDSIGAEIKTFPHSIKAYTTAELKDVLAAGESEGMRLLKERQYEKRRLPADRRMDDMKSESMELLEHFDIVRELNRAGYTAYSRTGGKIICSCPFHYDRHPSAYIDINPDSPYFGWLYCTSAHCMKRATLKSVLREIGALR